MGAYQGRRGNWVAVGRREEGQGGPAETTRLPPP